METEQLKELELVSQNKTPAVIRVAARPSLNLHARRYPTAQQQREGEREHRTKELKWKAIQELRRNPPGIDDIEFRRFAYLHNLQFLDVDRRLRLPLSLDPNLSIIVENPNENMIVVFLPNGKRFVPIKTRLFAAKEIMRLIKNDETLYN